MQELGTPDAAGAPVIPPQEVTVADAVVPPHLLRILRVLHADEAQLRCVLRGRGSVCLSGVCVCVCVCSVGPAPARLGELLGAPNTVSTLTTLTPW